MYSMTEEKVGMHQDSIRDTTFLKNVEGIISNPEELYSCVTDGEKFQVIGSLAWDLTSVIMTYLKDNSVSEKLEIYGKCLNEISRVADPKELYLGILEYFDPSMESKHVELLIPPLACLVRKLAAQDLDATAKVLETTYSSLSYYLESLNIPNYDDYDPHEKYKEIFEASKILRFSEKFAGIFKDVIGKICARRHEIDGFEQFAKHNFQFLCSILIVLAQLDLRVVTSKPLDSTELLKKSAMTLNASEVSLVAHDIMKLITQFHSPFKLWNTLNWTSLHPVDEISSEGKFEIEKKVKRGRACYFYLLLCHGISYDCFPKVFSKQWVLGQVLSSAIVFCHCNNQTAIWKGFEIMTWALQQTPSSTLSAQQTLRDMQNQMIIESNIDTPDNSIHAFLQQLINVALMLQSKTIRRKSIEILVSLLDIFLWEEKYGLLLHLLKTTQHAGVSGVLIGFLKDKLHQILQSSPPEGSVVFCEKRRMEKLGEIIFLLPSGTETDLLDDSDRLLPALNLLRFILIRDKSNQTGILDNLSRINDLFLKPLRDALDLSRAHYQNELQKHEKNSIHPKELEGAFYVRGTPLSTLPRHEQRKILSSALHTFDTIEIVTVRVLELIDLSKKTVSGTE